MIISFSRRFLFVAIPKTATHSFRQVLRPHLAASDWEQCELFEKKQFPVPELAARGNGHFTCREIRPYLFDDLWAGLYKFGTVRNPYDRYVSHCHFRFGRQPELHRDPLAFMKRQLHLPGNRAVFRPQWDYLCDAQGECMVDAICRFERLQDDLDRVCARIGIPGTALERLNTSQSPDYRRFLDAELADMIRAHYAVDFERLGYAPEFTPPP